MACLNFQKEFQFQITVPAAAKSIAAWHGFLRVQSKSNYRLKNTAPQFIVNTGLGPITYVGHTKNGPPLHTLHCAHSCLLELPPHRGPEQAIM